ncbi:MAG: response regulator transcription factor [Roseomonas sp.]|nr:response regulator transcription factor [Roseomonas sp.]
MRGVKSEKAELSFLGRPNLQFFPQSRSLRISILGEQRALVAELGSYLEQHGLAVSHCATFGELLSGVEAQEYSLQPDIVILQVRSMLKEAPDSIHQIRARSDVFCIVLGMDNDEAARVALLEAGCDACMAIPTSPREILARIRAALRRGLPDSRLGRPPQLETHTYPATSSLPSRVVELGLGWKLCLTRREIYRPDGSSCSATTAEFDLLACLVRQPGVPVSRDQISQAVYHRNCRINDRSVDNLVVRLRRKLEVDPRHPEVLRSIRLLGYMFVGFQAPDQPVGRHLTNRQPVRSLEKSRA